MKRLGAMPTETPAAYISSSMAFSEAVLTDSGISMPIFLQKGAQASGVYCSANAPYMGRILVSMIMRVASSEKHMFHK